MEMKTHPYDGLGLSVIVVVIVILNFAVLVGKVRTYPTLFIDLMYLIWQGKIQVKHRRSPKVALLKPLASHRDLRKRERKVWSYDFVGSIAGPGERERESALVCMCVE